jgi:IS30 family transposase
VLHKKNKHIKLTAEIKHYISKKLKEYWSPEKIVGRLELDEEVKISTETPTALFCKTKR